MSTQLHSMRRMGLLAGIGLAVTLAVVALWRLQLPAVPSTTSDLAVHPGATASDQMLIANQLAGALPFTTKQQDNQNTTAVLFLIDESGGVSGRCAAAESINVFVTDREGRRYELVRFYLQLWRAYYQFLQDGDALESVSRPISTGVMQFARQDQSNVFLEITAIQDLLNEQGADRFNVLRNTDNMLDRAGGDANWFCWTDFPSALDRAAEKLSSSEADRKVLVLLTDGSTRGNEREQEDLDTRSTARQSIERALSRLNDSDIEVLTVIWQGDECRANNDCGLSDQEFEHRKDDLARWERWEREGLLTLIDEVHPIQALAATPAFSPLLPGVGQYATGWIDGTTNQTIRSFFSEVARLLKVVVITSDDVRPGEIRFRPRSISVDNPVSYSELVFQQMEPQWYSAERDITGSSATCPQRLLDIRISRPVLAYFWLPFEQDWPKIKSVSVKPQYLTIGRLDAGEVPPEDRSIDVTVQLEPVDMNHHNCFLVQVLAAGKVYSDTLPRDNNSLSFSDIVLPDDLAHGSQAVTAQLAFTNAPEILAGVEKFTEFDIVFQPIIPDTMGYTSVIGTDSLTLTVPITFASQVPGFA